MQESFTNPFDPWQSVSFKRSDNVQNSLSLNVAFFAVTNFWMFKLLFFLCSKLVTPKRFPETMNMIILPEFIARIMEFFLTLSVLTVLQKCSEVLYIRIVTLLWHFDNCPIEYALYRRSCVKVFSHKKAKIQVFRNLLSSVSQVFLH